MENVKTELFDLYDVNRKHLGLTMERGAKQPPDTFRLVVHVCIFSPDGKMLCQKRVASKAVYPDLWDVSCGGCVDSGETSFEGAVRETREELGLTLPNDALPSITVHFNYGFDDVYCVTMDVSAADVKLQADEVSAIQWLSETEICAMLDCRKFVPYDKSYISYLFYCQRHRGLTDRETPLKGDVKLD
ncbi:MAG: NUDIX domain-containing protein [Corallococcus sp.]|nr:NUDIX domain-containing protein [Corallococcus sp.]MCM1359805.1 NUDIX domain-containing protein [Corallococcus sp.]MCM1395239.1 NUDIX domain-containing protein [Corallococcus sp.]